MAKKWCGEEVEGGYVGEGIRPAVLKPAVQLVL